jgi:clan AA aspartic protease (TIGR02281 family)
MTMIEFPFSLQNDGVVVVEVKLNLDNKCQMVLDTGCTNSVIHTDYARILGLDLKSASKTQVFTGSGEEKAKEITIDFVEALGHFVQDLLVTVFEVYVDSDKYVGYLGLDFFKGKKLSIDFEKEVIYLE